MALLKTLDQRDSHEAQSYKYKEVPTTFSGIYSHAKHM